MVEMELNMQEVVKRNEEKQVKVKEKEKRRAEELAYKAQLASIAKKEKEALLAQKAAAE
jgi:hypothetical protein